MKLKALELHGYKSFANRTEFAFQDGVTAIVGPNGSGKSNVADAIQWVLGEQSYSSLRAKKTEDMIFAGSSMRLRMGMAEVSLTLDNSEQWLPIEFGEVTITRRAYRGGDNEYLLNGNRARLRDISELLSKGGLGRGSYGVIGQGLIDQAISLRPEERRSLLEDAAGISLYQSKKADALHKLGATQENLTRVSDILHELEPRVRRLREQANRAGQFSDVQRKLAERLQTWYGYQWQQAQLRLHEAELTVGQTQAQLLAAREGLQSSDAERASLRERIHALRGEFDGLGRHLADQQQAQQQLSQRRAVAQERLDLLAQQHAEALSESDGLASERAALVQRQAQLTSELDSLQSEAQAADHRLRELQQMMTEREQSVRVARQSQADAQRSALEVAGQIAQHTQRIAAAGQRLQAIDDELVARRQTIDRQTYELQDLDTRIVAARTAAEARARQFDERARQFDEMRSLASAQQQHVAELSAKLAEARAELRASQIELERARARGLQRLLDAARAAGVERIEPLQALYRVAPENDRLVRGALGTFADALVVRRWAEAKQVAATTEAQQVILVLESFSGDAQPAAAAPAVTGADAPAGSVQPDSHTEGRAEARTVYSLISCAPEYQQLFETLLAPVKMGDDQMPRVSERGELFTPHALVTSDLASPNIAALETRSAEWQRRLAELPAQLDQAQAGAAESARRRDGLNDERYALETERSKAQSELDALVREREQRRHEARHAVSALTRLQAEQSDLAPQLAAWRQALEPLQASQGSLGPAGALTPEADDEAPALARQLAQQETRSALLDQEQRSREQMLVQVAERLHAVDAQREQRARRAERLSDETNTLRAALDALHAEMEALSDSIAPLRAQAQPVSEQLSSDEAALRALEARETTAREALYTAEAAHSQALVDLQRRQDRLSTLREQIESDYEFVSLTTDLPTALALEIDENRVLRLPHIAEIPDGMEQEIRGLKNKMRWIGNVNLEAPSEYALEKARLEFLQVQSTDLQRALESLQQLVAELDQMMQNKFRETFHAVARAFKEYFTRLFGGGSAELILTEPQNLITTGVDILAHPPGKRRQPLGLLSGGERALTAAALIFALLKASPTPFCVLDEVDAALDEANVGRFRSTLQELAERTQFIVITHNRGTVEAAGTVYGISMGADGASQMISLRLDGDELPQSQAA